MSSRIVDIGVGTLSRRPHIKEEPAIDPKTLGFVGSRMALQVLRTDEDRKPRQFATIVRRPWTEELIAAGTDYDKSRYFKRHETDPWLDAVVQSVGTRTSGQPMVYGRLRVRGTGTKGRKAAAEWFRGVVGDPLIKRPAHGFYDKESKTRFRAIVYWADEDLEALLVPMDSNIHCLGDLGITLSGDPKAPKRLKRAMAPHQLMLQFTVVKTEQTPDGMLHTLRHAVLGREFTVLSFDMTTLPQSLVRFVDGMNIVTGFAELFGREWDHHKFTAILPEGLGKGFGHAVPQVEPDVVLFGTKPELRVEGNIAYLGVLDVLHMSRDATLDIQTGVNMGFFSPELAPAEGQYWLKEIQRIRSGVDEAQVRDLDAVLARLDDQNAEKKSFFEPEDHDPSVRAAKLMLESQSMPVLWRRSIQRSLESTTDLTRGRILMTRVMTRLYLCPNLLAFHRTGRPDPSLDELTHANFPQVPKPMHIVCAPDVDEGPLFLVRNPNTTSREAVLVWNVHLGGLRRYRGRGIVFFSFQACELLVRLNGADFDDSVLASTDSRYIARWLTMDYPVTEKLSARADSSRGCLTEWNRTIGDRDITRWTASATNVGGFINDVMLDTLLSGPNRSHAIESIKNGVYWAPKNFSGGDPDEFAKTVVLPYLETYKGDFLNAFEANNSEYVIDWCAMGKGDEKVARTLFDGAKRIHRYTDAMGKRRQNPCYPKTWDVDGKCRIPADRRAKGDYLLVETEVCRSLNALVELRESILEAARRKEWEIARPIPAEVDRQFPSSPLTRRAAGRLRKTWRRLIEQVKQQNGGRLPTGWFSAVAHGEDVQEEISPTDPDYDHRVAEDARAAGQAVEPQYRVIHHEGLQQHYFYVKNSQGQAVPIPLNDRIGMAVEWLRQVYSIDTEDPVLNEDGTTRSFGDGVPNFVLHDYLTALEMCQLTGLVVYVRLDPRARRRLAADGRSVPVRIVTGRINTWVIDNENGLKLGTLANHIRVPDGAYAMSPQGVIVVKKSDESLHSSFKVDQLAKRAAGAVDEVGADFEDDDDPYAF
jgi:hypothetical protein